MTTVRPMLASSAEALPNGPGWTYEVKWDGYRALAIKDGASTRLMSRNDKNLSADYPTIVHAIRALRVNRVVLDGEVETRPTNGLSGVGGTTRPGRSRNRERSP